MITNTVFLSLLVCIFLVQSSHQDSEPWVETKLGEVVGSVKETITGKKYYSFSGIPYVKPPIGELRFKPPQPAEPWSGELQAKNSMIMCTQSLIGSVMGTEDCLVVNVHTPWNPSTEPPASGFPVMVWIHGGGFVAGGAAPVMSGEPDYLLEHDVVLVTVNYRLGIFGFLSTEDSEAPGNYGLLDQVEALKWVRNNIGHFGGDPSQVTIFGNSAGSASVHLLMLSPMTKGLFHRAIGQSGAALSPWAMTSIAKLNSQALAKKLGCPEEPSSKLIQCLREVDFKTLVTTEVTDKDKKFGWFPFVWTPRIDSESETPFLPSHPIELMKSGQYNQVPLLTGYTRDEGAFFLAHPKPLYDDIFLGMENKWSDVCKLYMGYVNYKLPGAKTTKLCGRVRQYYTGDGKSHVMSEENAIKFLSECMAIVPCLKVIELMSKHSPVYSYRFDYENGEASWIGFLEEGGRIAKGYVPHADELMFLFKFSAADWSQDSKHYKVVRIMTKIWTDFAKTGKPTLPRTEEIWPKATWPHHKYVSIDADPSIEANDFTKTRNFYEEIYKDSLFNIATSHRDEL